MNPPAIHSNIRWSNLAATVLQVAALYTFFLLFDQFAFLHEAQRRLPAPQSIQAVMAAMGLSGLVFSFLTARHVQRHGIHRWIRPAWFLSAGAALFSLTTPSLPRFILEGALIGASTGILTVLVAAALRDWVPSRHLGGVIGLGTGTAYALSNIPALFEGSFPLQATASIALCLLAAFSLPQPAAEEENSAPQPARGTAAAWTVGLLLLVALDAAAFAMIQQNPDLKAFTWGPDEHKYAIAAAHFLGAVLAGWLINRGFRFSLALGVWLLFFLAFRALPLGLPGAFHLGLLYAIGISIYSTLLVAAPSLVKKHTNAAGRAWNAALIFGIGGWMGSALGVGFAQEHSWFEPIHLLAPGLILPGLWIWLNRSLFSVSLRVFGPTMAGLLIAAVYFLVRPDPQPAMLAKYAGFEWAQNQPIEVRRGKEVYREEGCINCHSQYIRPRNRDVLLWGPYHPIDRSQTPPLVGNRRQGPDLLNVGLRRSEAWQRIHLKQPGQIRPGSRMPSYAHLFTDGSTRGEDLVQYLQSLGRGFESERASLVKQWRPTAPASGSIEEGAALFQQQCTPCHGSEGAGDGPLAALLDASPRDLRYGPYGGLAAPLDGPLAEHLARIVKFGLAGSSMPGHETFSEQQIADVVQFVASLQRSTYGQREKNP